jgi:hypothetical protein
MPPGPGRPVLLIAASADPSALKPVATWYMTTNLPLREATAVQVYERYRVEQSYKQVKHELGWADFQVRPARAIVRPWQLVLLAYTFSLLQETLPPPEAVAGLAPPTGSGRGSEAVFEGTARSTGGAAHLGRLVLRCGASRLQVRSHVGRDERFDQRGVELGTRALAQLGDDALRRQAAPIRAVEGHR